MRFINYIFYTVLAAISVSVLTVSGVYLSVQDTLPSISTLRQAPLQEPLEIYTSDGKLIEEFGATRRSLIKYSDIPKPFIDALLSAEDDDFLEHHGIDPSSLIRAASQLIGSGHIKTGGSTITMQVAKNYFLDDTRSVSTKINEIFLALEIERQLSKSEILELYVNKIYLGHHAYGIAAAAQAYYGKDLKDLTTAQFAMLAGLPKAPVETSDNVSLQISEGQPPPHGAPKSH